MTSNYICNHIQIRYSSKKKFKSDITPSFKPVINNGYKIIADAFMSHLKSVTNRGSKVSPNPFVYPNPPTLIEPKPTQLLIELNGHQPN